MSRMKHALVSDYNCADNSVQAKFVSLLKKTYKYYKKKQKTKSFIYMRIIIRVYMYE